MSNYYKRILDNPRGSRVSSISTAELWYGFIMTNRHHRLASEYYEGANLPPKQPGGQKHYLHTKELDPERDGCYLFTNQFGETWSFHRHEPVKFPRRDRNGTPFDWRTSDTPPRVTEICPGDILPPGKPSGVITRLLRASGLERIEDLPEGSPGRRHLEDLRAQEVLVVTDVRLLRTNSPFWEIVCGYVTAPSLGRRRYRVHPSQYFNPEDHTPPVEADASSDPAPYPLHGPYLPKYAADGDTQFYFAVHPGRGRWHGGLQLPLSNMTSKKGYLVTRPPKPYELFQLYDFRPDLTPEGLVGDLKRLVPNEPHPRDPQV